MIRVIACDLDGTLLDSQSRPYPRSARLLRALWHKGVMVVLATGRSWRTAEKIQRELGISGPVIAHNGAYVFDTALGRDRYRRAVDPLPAKDILAHADHWGFMIRCYLGFQYPVLFNRMTEEHRRFWLRPEDREIPDLAEKLTVPPLEMFVFGTREVEMLTERFGRQGPGYEMTVFPHGSYFEVNICAPGVDKVEALAALTRQLKIDRSEVLALGDGLNDVRMLKWAGLGVAMSHGEPPVLEAADYVTRQGRREPVEEGLIWAFHQADATYA